MTVILNRHNPKRRRRDPVCTAACQLLMPFPLNFLNNRLQCAEIYKIFRFILIGKTCGDKNALLSIAEGETAKGFCNVKNTTGVQAIHIDNGAHRGKVKSSASCKKATSEITHNIIEKHPFSNKISAKIR